MLRCPQIYKFVFVFCLLTVSAIANQFLVGTEDIPLMSGMTYSEEDTFSFENEEGRLYFSKAFTSANSKEIWDFYRVALSQLGWIEQPTGLFERDDEILKISIEEDQKKDVNRTAVFFELITKSK